MEALSNILQPYKEIVGNLAAIVTIGQMFSGVFVCKDIVKQGNTRGIPFTIFVGGLVMSILNLKFGYILRDDKMIQVNFFGIALNLIYILIFFHYSLDKVKVWAQIGLWGALTVALVGYAEMEDPKLVETRFGLIITAFMFYLIASPLLGLNEIIKNKSTEGLPFPFILSGTVVTFMWLLYGIILNNSFIVMQNLVACTLCSVQLSLFAIYPSKPKGKERVKAKKDN